MGTGGPSLSEAPTRPPGELEGLSEAEAGRRLARHGPNSLPEARRRSWWARLLSQFPSPLVLLLLAALLIDLGLWWLQQHGGLPLEALAIAAVLLLNAALGLIQEGRAEQALRALKDLAQPRVTVLRGGLPVELAARLLVPGDRARAEAGDRVPADGRLIDRGLRLDESLLTGESIPVDLAPGEGISAGTLVVRGGGWMEVTATGAHSALGRIAHQLQAVEEGVTPLERRLDALGRRIAWLALTAIAIVVALGLALMGLSALPKVFLLAVALAVAAVPEGLPAILTLTLALGVERMARANAVVRRLPAVEALGSVTLIATDKTGTITRNELSVRRLHVVDAERAWAAMILASDADEGAGDPLEQALLRHAVEHGVDPAELRARTEVLALRPFDARAAAMTATVRAPEGTLTYVKGAPERLLARCAVDDVDAWEARIADEAAQGGRLLGLAWGPSEAELRWAGLVVLHDPLREGVAESVREARAAGIRVVLVTGDHPATARAIGAQAGIGTRASSRRTS